MTDTGQVPGEGQPGYVEAQPEQPQQHPTAAAHGGYAYPDPDVHEAHDVHEMHAAHADVPGDDEDLLMPGAQSAWSDAQSPSGSGQAATGPAVPGPYDAQHAAQRPAPAHQTPAAQQNAPRRPLHLGPPVPEQSGAVRTLADRGPTTPSTAQPSTAQPPAQRSAPAQPDGQSNSPSPEQQAPPEPAGGPEYLDVPHQGADQSPGPQSQPGQASPQSDTWAAVPQGPAIQPETPQAPAEPLPGPDLAALPEPGEGVHPPTDGPATAPVAGRPVESPEAQPDGSAAPPHPEPEQSTGPQPAPAEQAPAPAPAPAESAAAPTVQPEAAQEPAAVGEAPAAAPETAPMATAPAEPGTGGATEAGVPEAGVPEAGVPEAAASEAVRTDAVATEGAVPEQESAAPPSPAAPTEPADAAPTEQVTEQTAEPDTEPAAAEPASSDEDAGQQEAAPAAEQGAAPGPDGRETGIEAQPETGQQAPAAAEGTTEPVATDGVAPEQDTTTVPAPRTQSPDTPARPGGAEQPAEQSAAESAGESVEASAEPAPPAGTEPADAVGPASGAPVAPAPAPESAAPSISEDGPAGDAAPSDDGAPATETPEADTSDAPADTAPGADASPGAEAADATEAAEAAAAAVRGPAAPGYSEAEREAVHRLMRERRDIRNGFRPDPIPHEVLLRVLEAAHTAPSVGHSQPWDFVVIRSEETRRTMHELARRQREVYAKSLPRARAKQFKELKIEAILETPVNIVVTADPTRGGRHTLGRHTQPQMAPYSSALAVENLWLAARAEGLGVGWVSFFDEREMVRALDLPEHLEVVAYLCIGYVDEFPAEPELMQAGWSKRRPLSWVVHEESYGRRALPGAEPHDLLAETLERIRPLDAKALGEAWERQKRMTKPAGALGMLEIISAQLCGLSRQCPPPVPEPAAVAVFAGDHGVHAQGVTPWPQEVTAQMVANFLGGGAVCNAFANQVGAEVCVVDVGVSGDLPAMPGLLPRKVRPGTADMTQGPALTQEEVLRAIEVGIETARDLVAAGNKALITGEMGIANTTASAALIAACTGADPAEVTGRGTGIDDETHARKVDVVRRALQLHQPDPADPVGLLTAVGGLEHAALTGFVLGGASLRTPVILDGVSAGAAALVARQIAPEALAACIAGHRSAEPGHVAALTKLGLRPLIDLDLRLGEGTGALLALPMVQSAARAMHEVATFDSAGVTEKN